ncbi:murein L,D-transpeptidase [Luteimonas sp. SJ-92]|uniref:Murein L,D-transpeptidase n=1 Tax=Luteimonas salinisoli TaxID=2752307 RepID=A0A853JFV8_9GAMM|nr:L,D-transpeptidase [Luteimonas salinisoli]NZA28226.1 murein L,D-transpeptidase [Luteimonas salinisoli]
MSIRFVVAIFLAMACAFPAARAADPATDDADPAQAGGDLHAQVLLARARFSPGEIDGIAGSNQARALRGFQAARDLPASGKLDDATWEALDDGAPALVEHALTGEDLAAPYAEIPEDMLEKAELDRLGYASAWEALGERFQASPELLRSLNPDVEPTAGATLRVPNVRDLPALEKAARVVVDESGGTLVLLDGNDRTMAQFPVTSGSENDPLPIGEWTVEAIAHDPTFHYNPELFWDADDSDAKANIAPGPNNPVGTVWIDLSKPHYGIHGTPEPASVGKTASHGCVRLTNWDALTVAAALEVGTAVVMQE